MTYVEWISVEDRLPENNERVLVYIVWNDEIAVDQIYFAPYQTWGCMLDNEKYKVTHWAKLPNKPKNCETL